MSLQSFLSINFPYCLEYQPDGSIVVLNREYKPLGFNTKEFITYKNYPINTKYKKIHPANSKKLSIRDDVNVNERIYLYDDGCNPLSSKANMKMFLEKLATLAKLKIKE